jgi:hypothetical protein
MDPAGELEATARVGGAEGTGEPSPLGSLLDGKVDITHGVFHGH